MSSKVYPPVRGGRCKFKLTGTQAKRLSVLREKAGSARQPWCIVAQVWLGQSPEDARMICKLVPYPQSRQLKELLDRLGLTKKSVRDFDAMREGK